MNETHCKHYGKILTWHCLFAHWNKTLTYISRSSDFVKNLRFRSVSLQLQALKWWDLVYISIFARFPECTHLFMTLTYIPRFSDFVKNLWFKSVFQQIWMLQWSYVLHVNILAWLTESTHPYMTLTYISWFSDFVKFCI